MSAEPIWRTFPGEVKPAKGHKLADRITDSDHARLWYLLRSVTRQEFVAEAALIDAGFPVYLPRRTVWKRLGAERKGERVERPLCPGYLFAGLAEAEDLATVEALDGVHAAIRFIKGRVPVPVPLLAFQDMLNGEIAGEHDMTRPTRRNDPPEGAEVQIVGGKFMGWPAKFVERREDDRIKLLFKMLGKWSPLVVDEDEVALTR